MSIIFYHNAEQRRLALRSKERNEKLWKTPLFTEIVPAGDFAQAEDYHQKYYLRGRRVVWQDLKLLFPDENTLILSAAAAKINGYIAGYGSRDSLKRILPHLGLSEKASQALLKSSQ
jgi:hypothetical protein